MTITLIQTDIRWGQAFANQSIAAELISGAASSHMYVLPEMWSTGFTIEPYGTAEEESESLRSGSLSWMVETARERKAAICGTLAVKSEGCFRNRAYFVFPDGSYEYYDKRHLFSPGGETRHYAPGTERKTVEFMGRRFLLTTCYDLRFPVWMRYRSDYDAIICMANWPTKRRAVWDTLLTARALENQCAVIGVNRTGSDISCQYNGGSTIVDAYGKAVVRCDDDATQAMTAELDFDKQDKFRDSFRVLEDRDDL